MKKGFLPFSTLLATITLATFLISSNSPVERAQYQHDNVPANVAEAYLSGLRGNQETGIIPVGAEIKARIAAEQLTASRAENNLDWVSLGPDNFGGRTTAVLYDNRDGSASTIYAATMGGGIFRSNNNGITWFSVGDMSLQASSMVQTANGTIFIGTGDGKAGFITNYNMLGILNYSSSFMGTGLYKMVDDNITHLPATAPVYNDTESDWAFIFDVAAASDNAILAATNAGLRFTPDGGTTWFMATDADDNELSERATGVKVGSDGTLMAAVDNKVYISKSGSADDFVNRSTGDSVSLPTSNVFKPEIAIAPSDPNVMYVALINSTGTHAGIYRSADKGDTWQVILPATNAINIFQGRGGNNSFIKVFPDNPDKIIIGGANLWEGKKVVAEGLFAWEMKSRSFFQFDPSYLHAGQQTLAFRNGSSNSFMAATDGGLFKGEVSGIEYTYTTSNRNNITTQFYSVGPSGSDNKVIGGAQNHGIIYISGKGNTIRQGEELWFQGGSAVNGHGVSTLISTINPEAILMSATGGQMFRSEDLAFTTSAQFMKDTSYMSSTANVLASSNQFKIPVGLWESYDNQNSRDSVTFTARRNYAAGSVLKVKSANNDFPFYYTLPANTSLAAGDTLRIKDVISTSLFVAAQNRLWMTREFLNFAKRPQWYVLTNNTTGFSGMPQSLAYSSDADHVFVGMTNGKLFRVSNIALAYDFSRADLRGVNYMVTTTEIPLLLPGTDEPITRAITSIAVDPNDANKVIVTFGNYGNEHYVFMSSNALADEPTFTSKQGNLPEMPVYASLIEMSNPNIAMVGTDLGVFVTENISSSSPSWYADQAKMGSLPVFDLKQQTLAKTFDTVQLINIDTLVLHYPGVYNYGVVYAATFGRGLYRANNYKQVVGLSEKPAVADAARLKMSVFPNPVSEMSSVEFVLAESADVSYQIFDLRGRMVQSVELGKYFAGTHAILLNSNQLQSGTYIIRMQAGPQNGTFKFMVY